MRAFFPAVDELHVRYETVTKRQAVIFFGGLTGLIVVYVAVAALPFYCKPRFEYNSSEPAHANRAAKDWLKSTDQVKPWPFEWGYFSARLMRPWDDDGNRIIFSTNYASPYYNDPDSIYAKESLVIWYRDGMQRFIRRKGTEVWKPY